MWRTCKACCLSLMLLLSAKGAASQRRSMRPPAAVAQRSSTCSREPFNCGVLSATARHNTNPLVLLFLYHICIHAHVCQHTPADTDRLQTHCLCCLLPPTTANTAAASPSASTSDAGKQQPCSCAVDTHQQPCASTTAHPKACIGHIMQHSPDSSTSSCRRALPSSLMAPPTCRPL